MAATHTGDNLLQLAPASPGATFDVRARVHNYYGIAPDVPRAAIVSDEAVRAWWSGASGLPTAPMSCS